jgi:hypothetical protein
VGLGTSSFGRASSLSSHYILNEEKINIHYCKIYN